MDESAVDLVGRSRSLEELRTRRFDLLVIGGGIIGAGVACEGARAGLAVALVERDDFGSQTSSASSKLIHGGLRYLRLGDVRLVREAHRERRALMQVVAPHLVRRLPFLLPLYRDGPYHPLAVQAGLWMYSTLAGERHGRLVPPERAQRSVPPLRIGGLRACGVYADAWTHDSRLCLANVRGAAEAGAIVVNHAEATALRIANGRLSGAEVSDRLGGESITLTARAVVNAAGPWIDRVRRLEDANARPSVRLSKGVHVFLDLAEPWNAALTIPHDKVRVSFAVPWEGMLLLGTTDTPYEGDPDELRATEDDVRTVLAEAGVALDPGAVEAGAVRSTSAGLRVLPAARGATARARRETVLVRGRAGMLTVAGGKLTTYRRIALAALSALRSELGLPRVDAEPAPLPGAVPLTDALARLTTLYPDLDPRLRSHLAHLYGGRAPEVVGLAEGNAELLEPLHPAAPEIAAQALYASEREWACTADDVLRRRTTLAARGLAGPDVVARVDALLQARAGTG
jgi:glycerol-3-phosphate dehydrogenase